MSRYQNHWAIQFILYAPYLTMKNKRDILIKKMNKMWYEDLKSSYKEALLVSYGNINEQKYYYPKLRND